MGFDVSLHTSRYQPRLMTTQEVEAGVAALARVAEKHAGILKITMRLNFSIAVHNHDSHGESLEFRPAPTDGGWELKETSCRPKYGPHNQFAWEELFDALRQAVNNKILIYDDHELDRALGPEDETDPWNDTRDDRLLGEYLAKMRRY